MINLTQFLPAHFLDSLGWAIVHSVWQGIIALSLVLLYKAIAAHKSPASHYVVQMSCLGLCIVSFVITFGIYYSMPGATISTVLGTDTGQFISAAEASQTLQVLTMNENQFSTNLNDLTPLVGILWCIGFLFMATRYFGAFYLTQQLKEKGTSPVSEFWMERFLTLAKNSGVTARVKLLVSKHVDGPLTIGFFKPVVLVPASFLSSLPQDQIEAILLHELAHIRRFDYLLNLIQVCIKTVLFYHPAIHIICRHIDENREQACDDVAVSQTHNPHPLVLGLASLRLQERNELALAAKDQETPLLFRLKRLVGPIEKQKRPEQIVFSVITAILIASLVIGSSSIAASIPTHDAVKEDNFSKAHNESYHFETIQIDNRGITIKKAADGSRWVLVDNSWYDIDRTPHIVDQVSSLPTPPQPPSPGWCESCELAGKHSYIDMKDFHAKMDQYQINMEYYAADMARYAEEVANKKPRIEEIQRWEENFNINLNTNINNNINEYVEEYIDEYMDEQLEEKWSKKSKSSKNRDPKNNIDYITYHVETDIKNTYQLDSEMNDEIIKMMLADGVISWTDDVTVISNLGQKITINGDPVPSPLCGKYDSVMDDLEIHGDLILQIPSEREKLKRVRKAYDT